MARLGVPLADAGRTYLQRPVAKPSSDNLPVGDQPLSTPASFLVTCGPSDLFRHEARISAQTEATPSSPVDVLQAGESCDGEFVTWVRGTLMPHLHRLSVKRSPLGRSALPDQLRDGQRGRMRMGSGWCTTSKRDIKSSIYKSSSSTLCHGQ